MYRQREKTKIKTCTFLILQIHTTIQVATIVDTKQESISSNYLRNVMSKLVTLTPLFH